MNKDPSSSLPLEAGEFLTLKYMTRFRCIGPECEEHCCKNWKISVDKDHYELLKKRMGATKAGSDKFQASVELNKNTEDPDKHATLKLRQDGNCSFLNEDGLCVLHRDYGESILCNTCASYPRIINIVGKRVELTASFSCPEIARQCLLSEDAIELVELDPKTIPREIADTVIKIPNADPFLNYVEVINYTVLKLLSKRQYSITARLFFCVYFSDRISPFYYRNTTNFSEDKLAKEMSHIENMEVLDELDKKYNSMELPNALTMSIIHSILILRIKDSPMNKFKKLVMDCISVYQSIGAVKTDDGSIEWSISYEKSWEHYKERKAYWESTYGERINLYFNNYCWNYLIKETYAFSPDLFTHFRVLLTHFAILRFLFFSHPDLQALKKTLHDTSMEKSIVIDRLDKIIVRITCLFTKQIEHDLQFINKIQENLDKQDIKSLAHLMFLLKF